MKLVFLLRKKKLEDWQQKRPTNPLKFVIKLVAQLILQYIWKSKVSNAVN